jgi:phospholipase C
LTLALLAVLLAPAAAHAAAARGQSIYAPYTFTTFAGAPGAAGTNDATGTEARFRFPESVAVDSACTVFVADTYNYTIRRITPAGVVTTLAGLPGTSGTNDGTGTDARFNAPSSVAVDGAGNIYVADLLNHTIRKVTPAGAVTTLAGLPGISGTNDGTGSGARFNLPAGVAVDAGTNVYVADSGNQTVRSITPAGVVATLAGLAGTGGSDDGTNSGARFNQPTGVGVDSATNVYVADRGNSTIRRITPAGVVTTLAGQALIPGSTDGTNALFFNPSDVKVDGAGNLYVADSGNAAIRRVSSSGVVSTLAGLARTLGTNDGTGSNALFDNPTGVALDTCGNLYVADASSDTIRSGTPAIQHVVLVMMENRSFDHLLGWLPGADGKQAGLNYTNSGGQSFATRSLAPSFRGCGCNDPDHSYEGGRIEYNGGSCDGWLLTNDLFSIGYYRQQDLSFFGQAATNWTVCDRYFAAIMSETQPNRIYQHAGQTDSLTNRSGSTLLFNPVTLPTIWDRLAQNSITGRYYYAASTRIGSVLSIWGPFTYNSISYGTSQFYTDCAAGALPAVSFVDPNLTINDANPGNDDHPFGDIRDGEAFLASIYNAVVSSPNWSNTVLIINFDEWGGFFDHVAPPVVQVEAAEQALGNDGRLGFRVPCLVISPWARKGYVVDNEVFDHTSVLKLIENRWGLRPLTVRDSNANDLADVLDFAHPDFSNPPSLTVPAGPFSALCQKLLFTLQADGKYAITWDALCQAVQLQSAPTILGPWGDAAVTDPPYVFNLGQGPQFYRLVTK